MVIQIHPAYRVLVITMRNIHTLSKAIAGLRRQTIAFCICRGIEGREGRFRNQTSPK